MTTPAVRAFPYIQPGDEITCTLATGMTLTGTLLEVRVTNAGKEISSLLLDEGQGGPPLAVKGDAVLLWRQGPPIQTRPSGLAVPVPQLAVAPNGGRPQG